METRCSTIAALLLTSCVFVASEYRPKPGECPAVINSFQPGQRCDEDRDCPGMEKCCSFNYYSVCTPPVSTLPRCQMRPGEMGICIYECSNDWNCQYGYVCCFNGCGQVCMPQQTEKPGFCGPIRFTRHCRGNSCFHDRQCFGALKCCRSRCGRSCVWPIYWPPTDMGSLSP